MRQQKERETSNTQQLQHLQLSLSLTSSILLLSLFSLLPHHFSHIVGLFQTISVVFALEGCVFPIRVINQYRHQLVLIKQWKVSWF